MTDTSPEDPIPAWLSASVEDAKAVDIDVIISAVMTSDANDLAQVFEKAAAREGDKNPTDDAKGRVCIMLAAALGMYFRPEQGSEPFGPMFVFEDRRSPQPSDFQGQPMEPLAYIAERTNNPVLRARLSDLCWLLERKRGHLGIQALLSYTEIVKGIDEGKLSLRRGKKADVLHRDVRQFLRRSLKIGRAVGWDKAETMRAKEWVVDLRKRAVALGEPVRVREFCELDLDFRLSDPAEVATAVESVIDASKHSGTNHDIGYLWRLAAQAYRLAKKENDAYRCQAHAAECLVLEADDTEKKLGSAMLVAHSLSQAIAELHGIPGQKNRRNELRHRLIDVQSRVPDELSTFSQEMDLTKIAGKVDDAFREGEFIDRIILFAALERIPDPDVLAKEATEAIHEHPLTSLFGASHLDREGKVVHRTPGSGVDDTTGDAVVQQQVAQAESIRRAVTASGKIRVARLALMDKHYLSEDVFVALLRYSPFIPSDLVATFARGFERFFLGDFVSAVYILTPLLENSLRYVLKTTGYDVTIFDDATKTQQDRTISSLFEQMRSELDAIFGKAITADIERVFLKQPGPTLRHAIAHGLLHDSDPHGADAIYGCWLIMRLCLTPIVRRKEELRPIFKDV